MRENAEATPNTTQIEAGTSESGYTPPRVVLVGSVKELTRGPKSSGKVDPAPLTGRLS